MLVYPLKWFSANIGLNLISCFNFDNKMRSTFFLLEGNPNSFYNNLYYHFPPNPKIKRPKKAIGMAYALFGDVSRDGSTRTSAMRL